LSEVEAEFARVSAYAIPTGLQRSK
jgi:hypothetical protein